LRLTLGVHDDLLEEDMPPETAHYMALAFSNSAKISPISEIREHSGSSPPPCSQSKVVTPKIYFHLSAFRIISSTISSYGLLSKRLTTAVLQSTGQPQSSRPPLIFPYSTNSTNLRRTPPLDRQTWTLSNHGPST
jgi:hypothetical protein